MPDLEIDSRYIAVQALGRILQNNMQLEAALNTHQGFQTQSTRDKAFIRLLVSSVFRHKGQIDQVLNKFLNQTPPAFVMNALRIGAVQTLVLGTPDHAAVGETVNLVKNHRKYTKFSGLTNAVLRRIGREGRFIFAKAAPRDNIPAWIYKRWEKHYGRANARHMALEFQKIPPLDISVKSNPENWAEKLGGTVIFGQTIRLAKAGQIQDISGYNDGEWWVQDVSSSLPVQLLPDVKDKDILDMCAAPGGKTLQLASKGAKITAVDKSASRLALLTENLKRTSLTAKTLETDARHIDNIPGDYDIVLLDAPCTATGTFRRHPDVLYSKTPKQMAQLQKIQQELLDSAASKLRPEGTLLYCTCSLEPEEGELQISQFLSKNSDFIINKIHNPEWINQQTEQGFLRLLPHHLREIGGLDGFFIASLKKKIF